MFVQRLGEGFLDLRLVGDFGRALGLAEALQRRMDERTVAGPVEFDLVMGTFAHPEETLEPELVGVVEQVLEAGGGDAAADTRGFLGVGDGAQLEFLGDFPVRRVFGRQRRIEEVLGPADQFLVVGQEQQAGRTQAVAFLVVTEDDHVQSPLGIVAIDGFAAPAKALERVGRVREGLFGARQSDVLPQVGGHEGVGMDRLGHEVIGQAEDHEVR